jgi:thiol-disulfide isomerase/thioredoxin
MKDCPYCVRFKDSWNQLKSKYSHNLKISEYERSQNNFHEVAQKYEISQFPTLKLVDDNDQVHELEIPQSNAITQITQQIESLKQNQSGGSKYKNKYLKYKLKYLRLCK